MRVHSVQSTIAWRYYSGLLLTFWLCLVLTNMLEVLPEAHAVENHSVQTAGLPDVQTDMPPTKFKDINEDTGDEWIDTIQRGMTFTVDSTARWLDQFFGDARAFDDQPAYAESSAIAIGRASIGPKWDEANGWKSTSSLRARFYLPNTDNRISAIIGRFDAENFLAGVEEPRPALIQGFSSENDLLIGLGYDPIIRDRQRLSLGAGFRGGLAFDPYLRARYLVQRSLTGRSQFRWQSVGFWRGSDGLGVTQRLDYETGIGRKFLGRLSGRGTYAERSEGIRWRNSASLFYLYSDDKAYAAEVWTLGETNKGVPVEDYGVRGIYRTRFLREWFFVEGWVGTHWLREHVEQKRSSQWMAGFKFEILFGRPIMQRGRQRLQ